MERTINDEEEIQGLLFSCPVCANTAFHQECFVKIVEIVNIKKKSTGEMIIISRSLEDTSMDDIEYNNEFQCPKCQTIFEVVRKDGVDAIIQIGLE